MANAFGRDSPWHGGTEPPPSSSNTPFNSPTHTDLDCVTKTKIQLLHNEKIDESPHYDLRTPQVQKNHSIISQSFTSFVSSKESSFRPQNIMSPPSVSKAVNITPDKTQAGTKLTPLGSTKTSNRFFTPKRKKVDEELTLWTKEKLVEEVSKLWKEDETKKDQDCNGLSEQELRKELYVMVTSSKKHKKKEEVTMDIGGLLVDSTMEYSPMLTEQSSDSDIDRLVKHDAILELANFIQMCGKRANMYQLHEKSLQELHEQLKLARDEHKKVQEVFPELQGEDAKWFGPKGERRDTDYEPDDDVVNQDPDDWWDDLITDEEINTITNETEETTISAAGIAKTTEEKAYLQQKHDGLLQQLLNEAKKGKMPNITQPDNTHTWTKEKLASTIIPLGQKLGKTVYYSVLMNQTKNSLRAKLATLQTMLKEKKEKENKKEKTQKAKKKEKKEKENKNEKSKKENKKNHQGKVEGQQENKNEDHKQDKMDTPDEPGSDGEFEWTENVVTQPDSVKDEASEPEVTIVTKKENDTRKKTNESITEFKETTPDEIIEILDRYTMIAIIYKRMKDDVKPLDFMLSAPLKELHTQLKYFRPLMGKNVIKVNAIDEEFHRKRDLEWGPQSEWGKAQKKHLENLLPKNFDNTLVLPSETPTKDDGEKIVKHHATFASVDREDRLNGVTTLGNSSEVKGVDISLFTPNTAPNPNSINEPPSANSSKPKNDVVVLLKKTFNVRVAYGLKHRGHHTPTDVKAFVKLLLSIDSNIKILPFESQNDNKQDHDVITNEEDLPETQDQLKKWAVDLEVSHNNKLHFGMRMSSTLTFAELRRHLFSWCTKTKSFVKFDNINSTKIFGVGWILGVHPSFHNRNTLKSVLFKNAPDLIEKVTIYPRRVWADSTATTQRVISNAIVIDGCFFARHRIIQHVLSFKWSGSYQNATFIPFKLSENFTAAHRQKAMQEQNVYLRDMWSKTVSVKNSTGLLKCKESGRNYSFITWLQLCEVHGKRVLQSVEYIDTDRIKILYHKDNEYHVCNMLTHMFPALEKQFGEEKATMLLGNKQEQMQQIKTKSMEHSYADIAAKNVMQRGNPQEDAINAPPKIKFNSYYGKNSQPSNVKEKGGNRQLQKSPNESRAKNVNVVTPSKSPSPISNEQRVEMNQMREAIKELKSSHSEQSKTIIDLNEKLKTAKEPVPTETKTSESDYSQLQDEIQALWKSQDEKYVEINATFDTKLESTKTDILEIVDKNKQSISEEIGKLQEAQEAATKSIKEQQSVGSMTLLTAIDKLANNLNAKIDAISNPPISPVEQGSRHGGGK